MCPAVSPTGLECTIKTGIFCLTEQAIPSSKLWRYDCRITVKLLCTLRKIASLWHLTSTASLPLPQLMHAQSQTSIIGIHSLTTSWSLPWSLSPVRGCMLFRNKRILSIFQRYVYLFQNTVSLICWNALQPYFLGLKYWCNFLIMVIFISPVYQCFLLCRSTLGKHKPLQREP